MPLPSPPLHHDHEIAKCFFIVARNIPTFQTSFPSRNATATHLHKCHIGSSERGRYLFFTQTKLSPACPPSIDFDALPNLSHSLSQFPLHLKSPAFLIQLAFRGGVFHNASAESNQPEYVPDAAPLSSFSNQLDPRLP